MSETNNIRSGPRPEIVYPASTSSNRRTEAPLTVISNAETKEDDMINETTPTSVLTASSPWQPSPGGESILHRALEGVDEDFRNVDAGSQSLTARILAAPFNAIRYLTPFKRPTDVPAQVNTVRSAPTTVSRVPAPPPSTTFTSIPRVPTPTPSTTFTPIPRVPTSTPPTTFVEPTRSVSQEAPSTIFVEPTFVEPTSNVSQEAPSTSNGLQDAPSTTASSNGTNAPPESPTSKLRSLVQAMCENNLSEHAARLAEARVAEARTARIEEMLLGLASSTNTSSAEDAATVNSRSNHSLPATQSNSSHEGDIDETNRYGRILASEAKKALILDNKFDGSHKNRNIFINKLSTRSTEVCWGHSHHNIVTFQVPSAGALKPLNLFTNHGALSTQIVADASKSWTPQQTQRAKHMYHCIYDSLSDEAILLLAKYQPEFDGNGPLLFMYVSTKLSKPTLAGVEERRLKRGLSEEALRKKMSELNYDISLFETYVTELQLEIASWNSQAQYPDLEENVLQALTSVKSSIFQFDVRAIQKAQTKRLAQYDKDGIESALMDTSEILQLARDEYLDHVARRTWKLDVLDAEESRLSLINDRKNAADSEWQVVDRTSSKSANSAKAADDSKTRHWRNEPPKSGDSHTRSHKNGRTGEATIIKWCENCGGPGNPGRWNSSHVTKDHNSDFYKDKQQGTTQKGSTSTVSAEKHPSTSDLRMSTTLIAQLANQGSRNDEEKADHAVKE